MKKFIALALILVLTVCLMAGCRRNVPQDTSAPTETTTAPTSRPTTAPTTAPTTRPTTAPTTQPTTAPATQPTTGATEGLLPDGDMLPGDIDGDENGGAMPGARGRGRIGGK